VRVSWAATTLALAVLSAAHSVEDIAVTDLNPGRSDEISFLEEESSNDDKKMDAEKYVAMRSDDYDKQAGTESEYHIRHLGKAIVLTTLSGPTDKKNGAWFLHDPLCPPGEGLCPSAPAEAGRCLSFEAADEVGSFLASDPETDDIVLKEYPFADAASATFCITTGKSNNTHSSFESLGKKGFWMTHVDFKLKICNNNQDSKCGKHSDFDEKRTFQQVEALFLGRCAKKDGEKSSCTCADGVVGKHCDLQCPGGCGPGTCTLKELMHGGREPYCKCDNGFVGPQCSAKCPKSEVTQTPCGSHGKCVMGNGGGMCECDVGFKGKACDIHCPAFDEKEETVCNGHGKCSLIKGVVDVGARRTKCTCQAGFIGARCDLKCPTGSNGNTTDICSDNGECALNDEQGIAECACREGRGGDACQFKCPRDEEGEICAKHGKCMEDGTTGVLCACNSGFAGPACELKCPGLIAGDGCSGHGRCSFITETVTSNATNGTDKTQLKPVCNCKKGFGGVDCAVKCPTNDAGEICSGRGDCNKDGKCVCAEGYTGPSCEGDCPGSASVEGKACSDNGVCGWDFGKKQAKCDCHPGFLGVSCSKACPRGGNSLEVCSGKGECIVERGTATCVCQEGFIGAACHLVCPGAEDQSVCNQKGHCKHNHEETKSKCVCNDGFLGVGCDKECPGLQEDGTVCNGHGKCSEGEEGQPNKCQCDPGFLGDACDVKCPLDKFGNICAGAGQCKAKTYDDGVEGAECLCAPGRVNYNCDIACPANSQDGTVCSGHGVCDVQQTTDSYGNVALNAVCKCENNFLGEDCFHGCPTVSGNTEACSGHGACSLVGGTAVCNCANGWGGDKCWERVCGSKKSFFNAAISKCTCEAGFTCCSREDEEKERERDTTVEMLMRENSLMRGKVEAAKKQA